MTAEVQSQQVTVVLSPFDENALTASEQVAVVLSPWDGNALTGTMQVNVVMHFPVGAQKEYATSTYGVLRLPSINNKKTCTYGVFESVPAERTLKFTAYAPVEAVFSHKEYATTTYVLCGDPHAYVETQSINTVLLRREVSDIHSMSLNLVHSMVDGSYIYSQMLNVVLDGNPYYWCKEYVTSAYAILKHSPYPQLFVKDFVHSTYAAIKEPIRKRTRKLTSYVMWYVPPALRERKVQTYAAIKESDNHVYNFKANVYLPIAHDGSKYMFKQNNYALVVHLPPIRSPKMTVYPLIVPIGFTHVYAEKGYCCIHADMVRSTKDTAYCVLGSIKLQEKKLTSYVLTFTDKGVRFPDVAAFVPLEYVELPTKQRKTTTYAVITEALPQIRTRCTTSYMLVEKPPLHINLHATTAYFIAGTFPQTMMHCKEGMYAVFEGQYHRAWRHKTYVVLWDEPTLYLHSCKQAGYTIIAPPPEQPNLYWDKLVTGVRN